MSQEQSLSLLDTVLSPCFPLKMRVDF